MDAPIRLSILGLPVDAVTRDQASAVVERALAGSSGPLQIVTINAEMAMAAGQEAKLAAIIRNSGLVLPDGSGIVWAARRRSVPVAKVPGVEFIHEIAARCAGSGKSLYLLGAGPGVADEAAEALCARHRGLIVAGTQDGYFSAEDEPAVCKRIAEARPGALLVALGVPRQEYWIADRQAELGVPVCMGVGGSFDVLSGRVRRAPRPMVAMHLEWFYRLLKEPWRWRRMAAALPAFVVAALASERQERYTGARR